MAQYQTEKRVRARADALSREQTRWLDLFLQFIDHLTIDSKETGVSPLRLYGSQRRFLAEVIEGLARDVHMFIALKARQLGISTVSLAIDLFWLSVHPGMQGALVVDSDGNREKFKILMSRYIASLPPEYGIKVKNHNRDNLVLENGSVLDYLVAGTRRSATELGRSRAYNFLHASEVANYGAVEGVVSLFNTLAETFPDRLYMFESTAKGYNLFWTLWQQAKNDPITQKAFFIGWWANEKYMLDDSSELFRRYWDGSLSEDEQERVNAVWERYGVRIVPGQLAWYRWKLETRQAATALMDQDFPWTEDDAFLQTGQSFFPTRKMARLVQQLADNPPPFQGYAYEFGEAFMDTRVGVAHSAEDAQLKVYEPPAELGAYVMGVDPAYGRSEYQDRSVIQVCRCYADRLVQVAEFATAAPECYQVAWPLAHLAGIYRNVMMIVEVSGPGEATVLELKHLRQLFDAGALPLPGEGGIMDLFGAARWYMYHRADSPGTGYCYNWKSNLDNKLSIMNQLRDSLTLGMVEVRSIAAAMEIQSLVQDGFSIQPAVTTMKDDRVFGLAFAHRAWTDWVRPAMIDAGDTWERVTEAERASGEGTHSSMVSHIVSSFFQGKDEEREEREIDAMWE